MTAQLKAFVESIRLAPNEIGARTGRIYKAALAESRYLERGNFECIHPNDLELLFDEYDRTFFEGNCRRALGDTRLDLRLSKRMTKTGARTSRYTPRRLSGPSYYEIAVSTTLLFETFRDGDRPITVTGLRCRDRLEALQRLFEHELIHLVEMLAWQRSNCAARRFQAIASRTFGHSDYRHQLITPRERAFTDFGIQPGSRVRFRFDGVEHVGFVNRITKRATVLVEDRRGVQYSDGRRYTKFYVPLGMLEVVN